MRHGEKRWHVRLPAVLAGAAVLASACSSGDGGSLLEEAETRRDTDVPSYYPAAEGEWATGDPQELGFDPAVLQQITAEVGPETNCLLVLRHGRLVGEWYWNGWTQDTTANVWSVTQAWVGTLVGIAQDQGLLDIDDPVAEYLPEWQGTEHEDVTIRHILSHSTGLTSSRSTADQDLLLDFAGSDDPGRFALSLPQEDEPGTSWSQNIPAIELLNPILTEATGQDPAAFAQENLFAPIGATHTSMTPGPTGSTWVHSFLESSCRDLGRFGYLILKEGNWDGTQVVSEEWVSEATQPSQDMNKGFGLFWWLNQPGSIVSIENMATPDYEEPEDLKFIPDAPEDMFFSIGNGGQVVQIHPGTDTVVVRLGADDTPEVIGPQLTTRVINDALVEP